ncbi:ShlB/FhaC/HecB family hemolysin secretion/activation protein [Pseudomonas fluorescens]|uniref:Hemolysin transporter protein ShlB n=1 Tax=Pseudomonas fluorescens TaxID=294 RepID=A0A5E6ZHE0_PSEFL|nr:ShlB/FhaC/HecB family hemolysin secretion/activation protein [Pseudomonas fluorescens]VVN64939.1 Hemolysin transporter protein ShlB [Pseudomonas fluorescens]
MPNVHFRFALRTSDFWLAIILSIGLMYVPSAWGDDPSISDLNLRSQDRERRTREQLELDQRLRLLERSGPAQPEHTTPESASPGSESCWSFQGLRLAGNTLITQQQIIARLDTLITPCMNAQQINQLLAALTQLYVDAGYIASRPYLASPPQDAQSLDIIIEEGFVESIELEDPTQAVSLQGAFPGMLGKPLQLRDLEQGLDQLNRLRSLDLTADIAPGALAGGSRLIIRSRTQAAPWAAALNANNRGNQQTGRNRAALSLSLDSPLGLNDFVSLNGSTSLNRQDAYSRSQSLYYNIPYGFWTLGLSLSRAEYRYPIQLKHQVVVSNGQTDQYALSLNRMLWRDQGTLLNGTLRLSSKRSDSYFAGQHLRIQSPRLTVAEASLNLLKVSDGIWSSTLSYAQGLDWLGADRDSERLTQRLPQAQFRKYRADISYWRQSRDALWNWDSQLALQYSPDLLPSLEQMLLTDDYAVRGFRLGSLSAAKGAVWRNTLSLPRTFSPQLRITPRVGLDSGWGKYTQGARSQRLAGASVGLGFSGKNFQVDVDYQRRLYSSRPLNPEPGFWLMEVNLWI